MSDEINHDRRRFLRTIAPTVAAIQLGLIDSAVPQSGQAEPAGLPTTRPGTNTSFGSLKQIDAGILNVGYAEANSSDGPAVIFWTAGPTIFTIRLGSADGQHHRGALARALIHGKPPRSFVRRTL